MSDRTGYATIGDAQIAYRVSGDRDPAIVYMSGSISHVDVALEEPTFRAFVGRMTEIGRLIRFDRRGSGASDPLPVDVEPTWETWVEDIRAVMDASGTSKALIVAVHEAGPMAMLFAASFPERVIGVVAVNTTARYMNAPDYPHGIEESVAQALFDGLRQSWGTEGTTEVAIPSMAGNPRFEAWYAKFQRAAATPSIIVEMFRHLMTLDIREVLGSINVPVLVIHRRDLSIIPIAQGRALADRIPGARFVEVPGSDLVIYTEHAEVILDEIERFIRELQGSRARAQTERALASVLFTDIVDSTSQAAALGDRRWRQLLDTYDGVARQVVDGRGGRIVKHTGDGTLATFDGPSRAIDASLALLEAVSDIGLSVRAGLHCGEIELRGDDIGGIGVHIASRVAGLATGGELLVSRTMKDLVTGAGYRFDDRGERELKGVPDTWQVFAVEREQVTA